LINNLYWTTASENNSNLFVVEKMGEDGEFIPIGDIFAAGNSVETKHYIFTDDKPYSGNNYYRLNQIDLNGNIQYSNIINVPVKTFDQILIFPNPFHENINIELSNRNITKVYTVQIFDLTANLLLSAKLPLTNISAIDLSNLNSGTYLMHVYSDNTLIFTSLIIKDL